MNLVIDTGNTKTKIAVFDGREMLSNECFDSLKFNIVDTYLNQFPISYCIHSYVSDRDDAVHQYLSTQTQLLNFSHETILPISIEYKTPQTLGLDRIATAVAANYLYPETNLLIIDAGTAITFDVVTAKGAFLGGNISLGLGMRYQALATFTSKLPHLQYAKVDYDFGATTNEAIHAGVQYGIVAEINHYIDIFANNYKNYKIILTGGDSFYFDKILKKSIFVKSNLQMIGLNRILEYSQEKASLA